MFVYKCRSATSHDQVNPENSTVSQRITTLQASDINQGNVN